jgi:hypothetical protein
LSDQIGKQFTLRVKKDISNILNIQLERFHDRIWMGQPSYARQILDGMNMWDNVQIKPTPIAETWRHDESSNLLNKELASSFRSCNMQLYYLANTTRPDLVYATNTMSQFQSNPRECDWKALIRTL